MRNRLELVPNVAYNQGGPEERYTAEERRAELMRSRLELAPNAAEEESKQLQILRGEGTITVKAEDGTTAEIDQGTMSDAGWNMESLGVAGL